MLKSILKYLLLFLIIASCTMALTTTGISYWAVSFLSETAHQALSEDDTKEISNDKASLNFNQPLRDYNLLELTRLSNRALQELEKSENVLAEIEKKKQPKLCATICNPSSFDSHRIVEEKVDYFESYYHDLKSQALADPLFRIKVEQFSLLSKSLPKPLRSLVSEIFNTPQPTPSQKIWMALRLENSLLREAGSMNDKMTAFRVENDKVNSLREMVHSCQSGGNKKTLIQECEQL